MLEAFAAEVFEGLAIRRLNVGCRWRLIGSASNSEVFRAAKEIEAAQVVAPQLPSARTKIAAVIGV